MNTRMNNKYTKLIETLPKESGELWFEYNLEVNKIIQENQQLKEEIRKYQKERDTNTKRHLEVQDYIKSRIDYCKEMTGFDCCVEELEEISKMV